MIYEIWKADLIERKINVSEKCGVNLKVLTFSRDYMKYVGLWVHSVGTILIENIGDTIDPNINLVLEKNYIIKNQVEYIILDSQKKNCQCWF